MKSKLLVVCGPTATGKTNLALHLAKVFGGELISADSRQVYKKLDIGTGKDVPENVKCQTSNVKYLDQKICFYEVEGTKIWGYDLIEPTKEFSVGQYLKIATQIIKNIRSRNKLPILVGGTGLYIKGVVDTIPTASIPQNKSLRKSLESKKANELFEILTRLNPIKAASMNISDKKNSRRLVRAIEVTENVKIRGKKEKNRKSTEKDVLFVGLRTSIKKLRERVEMRVQKRIGQGLEKEIEDLLSFGIDWNHQAMNSLGYKQWKGYFERTKTKENVVEDWIQDERNYVKRQLTWFKREKRINWFDISMADWQENIEKLVSSWYSTK